MTYAGGARSTDIYNEQTLREEVVKTIYDAEADALYVRFSETPVIESQEVSDGVVLDFDSEGRIVAIELLDATKHVAPGATFSNAAC
jgi:uncharacterized protein YuzE